MSVFDEAPTVFTIDILPANCLIVAQFACHDDDGNFMLLPPVDPPSPPTHVRFCAGKPDGTESEWSGWFDLLDIPIVLSWATFWNTDNW